MKLPDLDDVFGYYTIKYAHIRDARLGFIQKGLMLAIMVKIVALTIVYKCDHLLQVPILGSARANAQQPTIDDCDPMDPDCMSHFTPMTNLPYCSQFKAPSGGGQIPVQSEVGDVKLPQSECVYWDAPAMTRGRSPVPGTLFLPTRVTETKQKKGCNPDASNGYKCTTKPWVHADGDYVKTYMIADVERFSVLINQAFSADAEVSGVDLSGRAADFDGFIKGRPGLESFWTGTKRKGFIKHLEKEEKDELKAIAVEREIPQKPDHKGSFHHVFSQPDGDVFSVQDLLRMADLRGHKLLDEVRNKEGETMRSEGAVIAIDIEYTNDQKWDWFGREPPRYSVSAKYVPMKYYKIAYETLAEDKETRTMHNVHGLLFLIEVKGSVKTFTITNLLVVLTTAMVSLSMASMLTDYIMAYCPCLGLKDHYNILKYQASMDFSDLQDRITKLKEDCARKNEPYDSSKVKASAVAAIINDYASATAAKDREIQPQHMLPIICNFEKRLNRLDGMDACTEGDACDKCVIEFRNSI